jgi:hypothetical protein
MSYERNVGDQFFLELLVSSYTSRILISCFECYPFVKVLGTVYCDIGKKREHIPGDEGDLSFWTINVPSVPLKYAQMEVTHFKNMCTPHLLLFTAAVHSAYLLLHILFLKYD